MNEPEETTGGRAQPIAVGRIAIMSVDRVDDATRLCNELVARCAGRTERLRLVVQTATHADDLTNLSAENSVLVIVASSRSADDQRIIAAAENCMKRGVLVIVAFDPGIPYADQTPHCLHKVNGLPFRAGDDPRHLATTLLRLVGLDEDERRLFLSYRRGHGERLAQQMRYALIDAGWQVFLDTFSIAPGVDFQRELLRDLDGRSLVLVIESPETKLSRWVDDELAFARAHGIGIAALVLPTVHPVDSIQRFAESQMTRLKDADLEEAPTGRMEPKNDDPLMLPEVAARVVDDLQGTHTSAYRLRVDDMVMNTDLAMRHAGLSPERMGEMLLVGPGDASTHVLLATARRPSLADLYHVSEAMTSVPGGGCKGWVVHRLVDPDPDYIRLLGWVGDRHGVKVISLMDLRSRLSK